MPQSIVATLLVGALLAAAPVQAQDSDPAATPDRGIEGPWAGQLRVAPGVELRIELEVKRADDGQAFTAQLVSPDQSAVPIPVDSITASPDGTIRFTAARINASYEGQLDAEKPLIRGHLTQAGRRSVLDLAPDDPDRPARPEPPAELLGLWLGTLDVGALKLRLVLRVESGGEGEGLRRIAYLDSPDQGARGIAVTSLALKGDTVSFACRSLLASFEGKFDESRTTIDGTFKQVGQSFPLRLAKTDRLPEPKRSQVVAPPYPYREQEVSYTNPQGGFALAGTLTLPDLEGEGPYPAVVLITGSGPQDRNEELLGHKPFLVLADHLTRHGIAVLRADDRGFGQSKGPSVNESTTEELATDTRAAVNFLKTDSRIDPRRIGLIGHSEGGTIAPIVAAGAPADIAFIVLLAGTGVTGEEIVLEQSQRIARASGAGPVALAAARVAQTVMIAAAKSGTTPNPDAEERASATLSKTLAGPFASRWMRFFLTYDPRPALEQVRCPVLVLNGEKDLQVPPDQNLPEIEKALRQGGNTAVTIVELPGLNHLFQAAASGSPSEYAQIEETINPAALDRITTWLQEQVSRP